ncbi:hypothetical protein TPA0907_55610 [Micromonospora humidisoli]|uniref:hypothetical protein n=1 Tax=Micromonospora sp. AKA109 TaxID=2733865 RepID=UPI0022BAD7DF|nr:hypothetical protein [Micromonospora sp. AKA109]GHJ11194.1 hypothetical protein TPA0907_55610 [Micromonospora sp. AKA109]
MPTDRIPAWLDAIDDTLTATEAPAMTGPDTDLARALEHGVTATWRPARPGDTPGALVPEHGPVQPVDADRIPLRTAELSTAAQLAEARATIRTIERELDTALAERDDARTELAHSRDSDNFRAGVIREHAAELGAAGEVIAVVRDAQERIDRALAAYDTRGEGAPDDGTAERDDCERLADALEHAESVLVDNRDRIWRPAPDGTTYHRHPFGRRTRDTLDRQYGPTQTAMLIWLDGQDDEDDEVGRCEHDVSLDDECRQCLIDTYGPDAEDSQPEVPAPSPGSGPTRAQGVEPEHRDESPRRRTPRIVPYAERAPLYAAYQAAREWADQHGESYTDDGIIQAAVKAYGMAQLPAWVLDLVRGLVAYEVEHPKLFRWLRGSTYEQWACPGALLGLVPSDVLARATQAEPTRAAPEQPGHDDQCTPPLCAACGCWCHAAEQAVAQIRREAAQVQGQPTWDDCATVADALTAAPGTGEVWRDHHGDITGAPLSLARVAVAALADAGRLAAPDPIRPADWEQRAIDAVREALQAPPFVHPAVRAAAIAVRAIIDAGLAGPGGRCPDCGSTYPRTLPPGEDARCWTCSTEDQTGGLDEPDPADLDAHRPTVTRVLDGIRAGRDATLAQIERDAAQHQDAVLAGTARDEMTPAYPAVGEYHWGRAWAPTQDEATCPCPKAPCGYVIRTAEATGCELHGPSQTMRGGHFAASCPANSREG